MERQRKTAGELYKAMALVSFNLVVLVVAFNLVLGAVFLIRDYARRDKAPVYDQVSAYRERFEDLDAYARISQVDARRFLDEQDAMSTVGFQYEPWVQFRNPEFHGALLNTDGAGFRKTTTPRARGRPPFRIAVFGGSTTFGYGVPDEHTIPSYMQTLLETRYPDRSPSVKNFGQGFYYSSQEMLLFIREIKENQIPDWAVFIDGGNDTAQLAPGQDEPVYSPTVKALWDRRRGIAPPQMALDYSWIPMVRLANGVAAKWLPRTQAHPEVTVNANAPDKLRRLIYRDVDLSEEAKQEIVDYVVSHYTDNLRLLRAICREYGIRCLFVWQPHPGYKYKASLHRTFPFKDGVPEYFRGVYARMSRYRSDDFLYLGDMLEHVTEKVFVDDVHYNEVLNERIAARISDRLTFGREIKSQ